MKRKPYPAYKPSGMEWLGDVPEHWEVKRLKYSAHTVMGQSPNSDDYTDDIDSTPFLQGNADFTDRFPIPRIYCDTANKIVSSGALLISVRAPVGAINEADRKYGIGRGLCAIVPNETGLVKGYAWYVLQITKEELNTLATGSTYDAVSADEVGAMTFPLPSIPEQQSIAAFLDRETGRIDTLVAKKELLILLLREKHSALISHAVTKGIDPSVKLKPSGVEWLGDVPEHWEVKRCGLAYNIQLGKMLQPEASSAEDVPMPYFKALHVQWGKVICEDLPTMWASVNDAKKYSVSDGDLLVCEGGEVGRAAILKNYSENAIIQNSLHRVRSNGVNSLIYLMYLIIEAASRQWFEILCSKATIAHFTGEKFAALRIPIPPLPEQQSIATFLGREMGRIDALIATVEDAIVKLKEYRTALISAAVTGKIDVREAA